MTTAQPQKKTWLWAAAAAVLAWSGWIVLQGDDTVEPVAKADRANRRPAAPAERLSATGPGTGGVMAAASASVPAAAASSASPTATAARLDPRAQADAFGARSFEPPPPPQPKAAPALAAQPAPPPPLPAAPAAPPPPALPYKFVGMLETLPSAKPQVFLSVGDKLLVAGPGDALEGGFRLESIKPTELVFIHVQQGVTVRMPLSGAPS
ncbi:hypothetical protein [Leptothrix discophora]|uniref:Type II secretion system protein GspC N-terminal domain-containing protein n=1 Tax=Leptothrix discophora TaxID=89 RepID=A0ABT9G247_LEPDI|nr:hypothetical protein [Leptothrix discophora]MDP4300546.1 hypothetical protein [Leptothrix discophora]